MKYLLLVAFLYVNIIADKKLETKPVYSAQVIPKNMTIAEKKNRFYHLLVPVIDKVHSELMDEYKSVSEDIKNGTNPQKIAKLKAIYKVKSDKALLRALKPHPRSIVIAQAALESAWGTSRFFREANNVFGMWSTNKNQKRIAANVKRKGNKTVWLRKFDTIEDSVRAYYRLMARGNAFKEFRKSRYASSNVHDMVKKLDKYSEMGPLYAKQLSKMIRYNKLTKYDYEIACNSVSTTASK